MIGPDEGGGLLPQRPLLPLARCGIGRPGSAQQYHHMADHEDHAAARFKGFCFDYDRYRPVPPQDLIELAAGWCGSDPISLVVDLGCGTGLSTRPWAPRAERVVGIDPSEDMLVAARTSTADPNIDYRLGTGQRTLLEDASADIVSCSSAAHWMEPGPTVAEIARILRGKGVLVVYGHYYPVFLRSVALTAFYERWRRNLDELEYGAERQVARKWPLTELYQAVARHGAFGYTRRHYLHSRLAWTPAEVEGFFRAHAGVPFLMERGYSDEQLMLPELASLLRSHAPVDRLSLHLTYSVFLAVRSDRTGSLPQ